MGEIALEEGFCLGGDLGLRGTNTNATLQCDS